MQLLLALLSIPLLGASESQIRQGRPMCDAAAAHLNILDPQVRQQMQSSFVDDADLDRRFAALKAEHPVFKRFDEQNVPTEVVNMTMPSDLHANILDDVYAARAVETKLRKIMNMSVTGYNPFKLEFDMAQIFVPGCVEFMSLNRDTVRKHFPQMQTCQCNAFVVEKGSKAYGFHHASTSGYEVGELFEHGLLAPEHHMSFHTAVTASNLSSNPFTIFDTVAPEVFNNHFLIKYFDALDGSLPAETMRLVKAALIMYEEKTSVTHLRVYQDYLHAMYYVAEGCGSSSPELRGSYWELEPGQALYFNNWRVHGDSDMGTSEQDRVTIDLRCYSDMKVPFPFRDSYDWTRSLSPHMVNTYEKAAQCLLRLFNYSSSDDFLQTVFHRGMPNGVSYYSGLGNLGLLDGGSLSLMHENQEAGMNAHAARVRDAYKQGNLNYDAFAQCFHENAAAFDNRFKEAPLPWSATDQILFYPKLFVAFAPIGMHIALCILVCSCLCGRRIKCMLFSGNHPVTRKPSKPNLYRDGGLPLSLWNKESC